MSEAFPDTYDSHVHRDVLVSRRDRARDGRKRTLHQRHRGVVLILTNDAIGLKVTDSESRPAKSRNSTCETLMAGKRKH